MSNLLRNLTIALVLAVMLWFGYVLFIRGGINDPGSIIVGSAGTPSAEAIFKNEELRAQINEIESYKVDASLFDTPTFKSLKDFRVDLGTEPTGRINPFTPTR